MGQYLLYVDHTLQKERVTLEAMSCTLISEQSVKHIGVIIYNI